MEVGNPCGNETFHLVLGSKEYLTIDQCPKEACPELSDLCSQSKPLLMHVYAVLGSLIGPVASLEGGDDFLLGIVMKGD